MTILSGKSASLRIDSTPTTTYSSLTTSSISVDVAIMGGSGHKAGTISNTEECYRKLEDYTRTHFDLSSIDYRWSTQDMVSFDKLPYIGKPTPFNKHIYVAIGFSLWGVTKGTMAGMLLSDTLLSKDNPAAEIYDAIRATPFVTPESIKQGIDLVTH